MIRQEVAEKSDAEEQRTGENRLMKNKKRSQ